MPTSPLWQSSREWSGLPRMAASPAFLDSSGDAFSASLSEKIRPLLAEYGFEYTQGAEWAFGHAGAEELLKASWYSCKAKNGGDLFTALHSDLQRIILQNCWRFHD